MLQGRLLKNQTKVLTVSTSSHVAGDYPTRVQFRHMTKGQVHNMGFPLLMQNTENEPFEANCNFTLGHQTTSSDRVSALIGATRSHPIRKKKQE